MKNKKCPQCGTDVMDELPGGLCPTCLMLAAQQSQPQVDRTQAMPAGVQTPTIQEIARLFPELEIIRLVGRGGMGAVYQVRQKNLDRVVALKVFLYRPDDPEFAARFQREARALARLNHPNIVTVHDFGVRENAHYLIMEFIDGLNLRQLSAEEKLSPEMALQMVPQLCDALQFAHDHGVIHRDIKPENLLLDTNGRITIADFGLAKMTGSVHDGTLTRTQQVMGTYNYMAPEQRERPTEVDHRADIYSLGVVIYELLTGELPIGRFQPPSSKSNVNGQLDEVVMRALEKEPERRYQQASEFRTGFESVGDYRPVHDPAPPVKQFAGAGAVALDASQAPKGTQCMLSFLGGREKKGAWVPGDPQMAISFMGSTVLDLTQVERSHVNLTLLTLMGGTEVIVPHGATVDVNGLILMGATSDNVVRSAGGSPMTVNINSWGAMGACDVRTPTRKETRAADALERRSLQKPAKQHQVSFGGFLVFLYQMMAMFISISIPILFLCGPFGVLDGDISRLFGVLAAIFTGYVWAGSDYFRILVGAGPKEDDQKSIQEYYSATKLGTLVRWFAMTLGFMCPMLFVWTGMHNPNNEQLIRFVAIVCAILCGIVYGCADQMEEFLYGKRKD